MAFSPSQAFFDCTDIANVDTEKLCISSQDSAKRQEEYLIHYFENGDSNSYLAPLDSSLGTVNSSLGAVEAALDPLPEIATNLDLFFLFPHLRIQNFHRLIQVRRFLFRLQLRN